MGLTLTLVAALATRALADDTDPGGLDVELSVELSSEAPGAQTDPVQPATDARQPPPGQPQPESALVELNGTGTGEGDGAEVQDDTGEGAPSTLVAEARPERPGAPPTRSEDRSDQATRATQDEQREGGGCIDGCGPGPTDPVDPIAAAAGGGRWLDRIRQALSRQRGQQPPGQRLQAALRHPARCGCDRATARHPGPLQRSGWSGRQAHPTVSEDPHAGGEPGLWERIDAVFENAPRPDPATTAVGVLGSGAAMAVLRALWMTHTGRLILALPYTVNETLKANPMAPSPHQADPELRRGHCPFSARVAKGGHCASGQPGRIGSGTSMRASSSAASTALVPTGRSTAAQIVRVATSTAAVSSTARSAHRPRPP
jgi:hypothetical protein